MPTMTQPPVHGSQPPVVTGSVEVTGGVDTHKHTYTAAVVDAHGRVFGHPRVPHQQQPATARCWAWPRSHGELVKVGIEGTGECASLSWPHLEPE